MFGGSLLLLTVRRLKQYKLKERYALIFLFTGLPFLALALWPDAMAMFAELIHIDYRTFSLMLVSAFLLLMVLELLSIVSQQDRKITTLAQMVGILMEKQEFAGKSSASDTQPRA